MTLAVGGIIANILAILGLYLSNEGDYPPELFHLAFTCCAISVAGLVLCIAGSRTNESGMRKFGAFLIIISSLIFIPLGVIAIAGAKRFWKTPVEENAELERRRQAAKN
ncbi:hypothetical protein QN096_16950 [Metapseudomonas otitidis]|jgi:hypothetical protein|uniref:hypothetical protein n=1 Tax=Metapseudomonas otitidis TaxID=319939 RepID=UPI002540C32E|nr:hypothetical protein [Pseudomonas otitidis]WIF65465.1 hypothetical protein QN096_16950 [Pseudomonas otitidis]